MRGEKRKLRKAVLMQGNIVTKNRIKENKSKKKNKKQVTVDKRKKEFKALKGKS